MSIFNNNCKDDCSCPACETEIAELRKFVSEVDSFDPNKPIFDTKFIEAWNNAQFNITANPKAAVIRELGNE